MIAVTALTQAAAAGAAVAMGRCAATTAQVAWHLIVLLRLRAPLSTTLYIDADACPVKDEAVRVGERHGFEIIFVSNAYMRLPEGPLIKRVVVPDGPPTRPTTGLRSAQPRATSWSRPTFRWRRAASRPARG